MIERHPIKSRAEWLKWRKKDITASDIGAIFGLSPYKTPLQVWAEKTGKASDQGDSAAMRRGRWLEDGVLNALREMRPNWTIRKPNEYLRDPVVRIGATPDAVAADTAGTEIIVQCKVTARPIFEARGDFEVSAAENPPMDYALQTLTEAMLWDAPHAVLATLVIDTYTAELVVTPIERNQAAEDKIRDHVRRFWRMVEAGEMPTADYERDGDLIAHLYKPRDEVEPIDLSNDNRLPEILAEREKIQEDAKRCEDRLGEIKAEILEKLKGSTVGVLPGWRISNKVQHRKEVIIPAKDFAVMRIKREKQ